MEKHDQVVVVAGMERERESNPHALRFCFPVSEQRSMTEVTVTEERRFHDRLTRRCMKKWSLHTALKTAA